MCAAYGTVKDFFVLFCFLVKLVIDGGQGHVNQPMWCCRLFSGMSLRIIFKDAVVMIILTDQIFLMPNSEMILNDPNREMPLRPTVSYFPFTRLQSRLFPRRICLQWCNSYRWINTMPKQYDPMECATSISVMGSVTVGITDLITVMGFTHPL